MKKGHDNSQLLEAMGTFSEKVDSDILEIRTRAEMNKENVASNKIRIDHIEKTLATTNYLNYKMADLKGELLEMIRAEFKKLSGGAGSGFAGKADQIQQRHG